MLHTRSQNLNYGQVTRIVAPINPTPHPFLGISAQLDSNSNSIKPKLVWAEDSQFPQRKEYLVLLLRGDTDVKTPDYKNPSFLFTTYDQNRRTGGVATAWLVDPIPKPERPPTPEKTRPKLDLSSPESLEAKREHEEKEQLRLEQERALALNTEELQEEDVEPEENSVPIDPVKTLEKNVIEEDAEDLLEEFFGEDE